MKKILLPALALASLAFFSFAKIEELPIGASLPKADKELKDISGKTVKLKDAFKKNGLLVMFSCNTCPYVVKNQERTVEISQFAVNKNIGVVLINSNEALRSDDDSFEAMKAYAKEQKYKWPYLLDEHSELADAFGASRTPETFLFDKNGKLVYHGAIDDSPGDVSKINRKHLKEAINELVEGKDISIKTSRSVGCSIKRA